jgi:hypothetical protein
MKTIHFSIAINAPKEKVWNVLWSDHSYRQWTSVFSEGSYADTDWQEGSKALFLDGKGSGMVSRIASNKPNQEMAFEHLGMVKDGKEDLESDEVKAWAGAMEKYTLAQNDGATQLSVDLDSSEAFASYFNETFPKALQRVKDLSESE